MAGVRGRIGGALRRVSGTTAKQTAAKVPTKAVPVKKTAPVKNAAVKNAAVKNAVPVKKAAVKKTATGEAPTKQAAMAKKTANAAKKVVEKKVVAKKLVEKKAHSTLPAGSAASVNASPTKTTAKSARSASKAVRSPAQKPAASPALSPVTSAPKADLTEAELREIRARLTAELTEMQTEYDRSIAELNDLQMTHTDGAGDDQADVGSKTFEREQEQSIAANRHHLLAQIEHAFERMDAGTYGICENCGRPIPKARLTALPMATMDAECKARQERH